MPGEPRFDVGLELDDLAAQVGVDLVGRVRLDEDVELTLDQRLESSFGACGAERGEDLGIGQRVGERHVGNRAQALGLVARAHVGFPPRGVGGRLQRLQPRAALGRERVGGHLNQMRW